MKTRKTADEIVREELRYVTKNVAMSLLGVSEKTLRKLRKEGNFVCVLYKNTFWYSLDSINRFFEKHKVYYGKNCITK